MLHSSIRVRDQGAIEGKGLFAIDFIPRGALIWHLLTATMSQAETEMLKGRDKADFKYYGFQCGVDRFFWPKDESREMNHSCDPNTWWADNNSLVASRDIASGEEITYDYSTTEISRVFEMSCHCGASSCRKRISGLSYLDPDWRRRYGLNLPTHVLQVIEQVGR